MSARADAIVMLLRHAERPPIPAGAWGTELGITPAGRAAAIALGARLGPRLCALRASPLRRCVETAEAIREEARVDLPITADPLLGGPGAFVCDEVVAGETLQRMGLEAVLAHLMGGAGPLPGWHEPRAAAEGLARHVLGLARGAGVHVSVTHDAVLAPLVSRLQGRVLSRDAWPPFLSCALLSQSGGSTWLEYQDQRHLLELPPAPPAGSSPSTTPEEGGTGALSPRAVLR
jgi:broad specificity phosphatase PhoE